MRAVTINRTKIRSQIIEQYASDKNKKRAQYELVCIIVAIIYDLNLLIESLKPETCSTMLCTAVEFSETARLLPPVIS